jgi:hypothetical protein
MPGTKGSLVMSRKSLLFAGVAIVAVAAAAMPASAAPNLKQAGNQMGPAIMFNLLDRNGDGAIDKDEAGALTTAIFSALDTDNSGTLTQQELGGILNHWRTDRAVGQGPAQRQGQRGPDGRGWNSDGHPGPHMADRGPDNRGWNDGHFGPRMADRGPDDRGWSDGRFGPGMTERGPLLRHPGMMGSQPGGPDAAQGPGPNMGQGAGPMMQQGAGPNFGQGPGPNMAQVPGPNAGQGPGPMMQQGPGPNAAQGVGPNTPQGPGPVAGQGDTQTAQADVRTRMFDYLDTNHDGVISKDEFDAARFPHPSFGRNR